MLIARLHIKAMVACILLLCLSFRAIAKSSVDTTITSTQQQAIVFLDHVGELPQSIFWPAVKPVIFLQNLRKDVLQPLSLYEGRSTNFCAYAAMSYMPLHDDPLTFVTFMVQLYTIGKADYGKEHFNPSKPVKLAAGTLRFKGELDIRPADQLWFLALADHFKGYLNVLDKHFDMGDENKMWAAVNFAKFNRMIRRLFNYETNAAGSDLIRPMGIDDIYEELSERLKTGHVALFVNNLTLYKKNHTMLKYSVPTHFIILLNIEKVGDNIAFTYWDYGGKTLQELSPYFLRRIIYGISHIKLKTEQHD